MSMAAWGHCIQKAALIHGPLLTAAIVRSGDRQHLAIRRRLLTQLLYALEKLHEFCVQPLLLFVKLRSRSCKLKMRAAGSDIH
jgi:hypothetical protein